MPSKKYKRVMGDISEMTRWRHEKACIGPMPIKFHGRNFYFEDEVEAYLEHLAATRHQIPDDQSTGPADDENLCLAKRTAETAERLDESAAWAGKTPDRFVADVVTAAFPAGPGGPRE